MQITGLFQSPIGNIIITSVDNKLVKVDLAPNIRGYGKILIFRKNRIFQDRPSKGERQEQRRGAGDIALTLDKGRCEKNIIFPQLLTAFKFKDSKFNLSVIKQLDEYFSRKRKVFDIPVEYLEGTSFQKAVWAEVHKIEFGKTVSYKDICNAIGNPDAQRAVGNAVGKNPIPIIVPCHRIIKSDGKIGNYAYGGNLKQYLLKLENL